MFGLLIVSHLEALGVRQLTSDIDANYVSILYIGIRFNYASKLCTKVSGERIRVRVPIVNVSKTKVIKGKIFWLISKMATKVESTFIRVGAPKKAGGEEHDR